MPSVIDAPDFPAYWADCVNRGRIDDLVGLYDDGAVLMPTFSPHVAKTGEALRAYFDLLASRQGLRVTIQEDTVDCQPLGGQSYVLSGVYDIEFDADGALRAMASRFTFVVDLGRDSPILHHHSSQIPTPLI